MNIHVFSYCLFTVLCVVESAVTKVTGVAGGPVEIRCFISGAETNIKYFCKKTCSNKDVLIQTKNKQDYVVKRRYIIHDLRNGVFTVKVNNLKKSDSGTYWCGVERRGPDSYQEVYITVTDAPPTPKSSTINPRFHVTTNLLNLSPTYVNVSTSLPNLSATSSSTFFTSGDIRVQSSTAGLVEWTSVCLVVMVTVALALLLIYRQMKATRRPLPQPGSININPTPAGEADGVYEEIIESDRHTLSVVSSSIYYNVNSPTTYPGGEASASYPASRTKADPHCDLIANSSCSKDDVDQNYSTVDFLKHQVDAIYSTADHPDVSDYSSLKLPKDS
ncbi:hypothetical protein UPYG_G00050770 [Umbra pygmaea]|uniref:Ig-like domain-containing protein n=1 Tax=Umbra pygmaea TaxID=75934 RepID=A0ABD0XAW6_UMBPY